MRYELRDIATGSKLENFSSRNSAMEHVRKLVDRSGIASVKGLALHSADAHGRTRQVARGNNLANMAAASQRHAGPAPPPADR